MFEFLIILFLIAVFLILHTYLFYPLSLLLFGKKQKPGTAQYAGVQDMPAVSILIAAYNEEQVIEQKILSTLKTTFPLDRIEIIIGSDASLDRTNDIVKNYAEKYSFIKFVDFAGRTGKANIINQLVPMASNDILILTDANVLFTERTIENLIRHFKNTSVSQVCGNIVKTAMNEGISGQEKTYMAMENQIKLLESNTWNFVMGAEGGCNAMRKKDYKQVPSNFCVDDFYLTLHLISKGGEIIFEKDALCYEDAPSQSSVEFRRKVRISTGNFQNLFHYKSLLLPFWKASAYAFWSHKVLRWFTPFLLLLSFLSCAALAYYHKFFFILALLQLTGMITPLLPVKMKLYKLISHFYFMNLALLKGFFKYLKGVESNIWQPTQRNV